MIHFSDLSITLHFNKCFLREKGLSFLQINGIGECKPSQVVNESREDTVR
jgi:hypothetical protein